VSFLSNSNNGNFSNFVFSGTVDESINLENPTDFQWQKLDFTSLYTATNTKWMMSIQLEASMKTGTQFLTDVPIAMSPEDLLLIFPLPDSIVNQNGTVVQILRGTFQNTSTSVLAQYSVDLMFNTTDAGRNMVFQNMVLMKHNVSDIIPTTGVPVPITTGVYTTGHSIPATTGFPANASQPTHSATQSTPTTAISKPVVTESNLAASQATGIGALFFLMCVHFL